jgi:hypothetical protein
MNQQDVINLLKKLILKQTEIILSYFPNNDITAKRHIVFEMVRSFDSFFAGYDFTKPSESYSYYRYGWNEVFKILFGQFNKELYFPLISSNNKAHLFVNDMIQDCAKIGLCNKIIDYYHAGLVDFTIDKNIICVNFVKENIGELHDSNAAEWVNQRNYGRYL